MNITTEQADRIRQPLVKAMSLDGDEETAMQYAMDLTLLEAGDAVSLTHLWGNCIMYAALVRWVADGLPDVEPAATFVGAQIDVEAGFWDEAADIIRSVMDEAGMRPESRLRLMNQLVQNRIAAVKGSA